MQLGDIGQPVDYQELDPDGNPIDITGASSIVFHFETPSGELKQFNGTVFSGVNGIFRYTSALATDFDEAGPWKVQVSYVLGGFNGRTFVGTFTVYSNI